MIHNVWFLLSNSGLPLLTVNYRKLDVDDNLIMGFLSAMQAFAREVTSVNLEAIKIGSNYMMFTLRGEVMTVVNADPGSNELMFRRLIRQLEEGFLDEFGEDLSPGDVTEYQRYRQEVDRQILESKLEVRCRTCSKKIPSEFIEVTVEGEHRFYCCQSCKSQDLANCPSNISIMSDLDLHCDVCGEFMSLPKHCGFPMSPNDGQLVCWMGADCNSIEFPTHCGEIMRLEFSMH